MKVFDDHKADTINNVVTENFKEKSLVFSDKSINYVNISDYVEIHLAEKPDNNLTKTILNGCFSQS